MKRLLVFTIISIFVFTGCAWFGTKEEKSAKELAYEGMDNFKDGKYRKSIEQFEKLRDWYPFSKFAILAELKIADAYYELKEYDDAIFAYEEFENLHPRNEATPYVIYQIGRCYFDQMDTVDRDQTSAKKAFDIFQRLKRQYPDNRYAYRAEDHAKKCLKSLAGHELYVGLFYLKSKHYKAALNRFQSILSNYPDVGVHQKALQYIALCKASLTKQQEKKMPE
jgi:outer membrane protein assembly factor BamD